MCLGLGHKWSAYIQPRGTSGGVSLTAQVGRYYRNVAQDFFDRHHRCVLREVPGGDAIWQLWAASPPDWRVDWNRTMGALEQASCLTHDQIKRRWAEFVLHLCVCGFRENWGTSFTYPVDLQYRNGMLRRVLSIRGFQNRGKFKLHVLVTKGDRNSENVDAAVLRAPHIRWGGVCLPFFSFAEFTALGGNRKALTHEQLMHKHIEERCVRNCARAARLLDRHAQELSDWVKKVVCQIVVLPAVPGCTLSFSDPGAPGVVLLSLNHDPIAIAESLVHEASHAYFRMLEQAAPVDDGSDKTLYYSPFKRELRPIRAILFAYHAFANVALFYRTLLSSRARFDRDAVSASMGELTEKLGVLRSALMSTSALTPPGIIVRDELTTKLNSESHTV